MNKKIIWPVVLVSLTCPISFAFGQQITNPLASAGINDFPSLLCRMAGVIGTFIASVGTIVLIISGIYYITSAGSQERMGTAKKALVYAIIGMVVGLCARLIVGWVATVSGGSVSC